MKKLSLFLILNFFVAQSWAQDLGNQGIMKDLIEEDFAKYIPPISHKLGTRFIADVGFDDNYQATNRQNEYKDGYAKARLLNNIYLGKNFALNSYVILDRIDNAGEIQRRSASAVGGGDRAFENLGAYIQELNLTFDRKNYALIAGKFNLNFGNAWRWNRGIWIQTLAENYKQIEKLGFGGVYRLGNAKKTGQYNFSFSNFVNDRKNLDNSLMIKRDSAHKSDALPGDSTLLQSYTVALDINFDFGEKEKLSYHFSHLNLAVDDRVSAVNRAKIDDQKAFALGMNYQYPATENIGLEGFLEYVEMKNVGGNSDIGERYLTANLITKFYNNWSFLLGSSSRQNLHLEQNGFDQNLSEISLGYEFNKNSFFDKLTLQAGYKNFRTNYKSSLETNNSIGLLLRYYKNF